MEIGQRIKLKRKEAGLTQQQLGGEEFTKGYISQIEKGTVEPSMKVLSIISHRLKTSISYFLDEATAFPRELEDDFITGKNYFLQRNYNEALQVFKNIAGDLRDQNNYYNCLSLLYWGKSLYFIGNYNEAIEIIKKSLSCLNQLKLYEALAEAYSFLGLSYFGLNQYDAVIKELNGSLKIIKDHSLNLYSLQAKLYLNIGTAYSNTGRFKRALSYFKENINLCQRHYITDTLLDCHIRIAYCSYKLRDYSTAKEHLAKAIAINKSLSYDIIRCEIYSILGMVIAAEGRLEIGIQLLNKSKAIAEEMKYEFGVNANIAEIVLALVATNRLEAAEDMALKHIDDLRQADNLTPSYHIYGGLGKLYSIRDDYAKAKEYLIAAIEGFIKTDNRHEVIKYSKLLADILIDINPREAKDYYDISMSYLSLLNDNNNI